MHDTRLQVILSIFFDKINHENDLNMHVFSMFLFGISDYAGHRGIHKLLYFVVLYLPTGLIAVVRR